MAEMDLASGDKTVVVLSWGMSDALQTCLGKLGTPSGRVIWVNPISDGDLPQPLAHARPVERIEAVLFDGKRDVDLREYSLPGLRSMRLVEDALLRRGQNTARIMDAVPNLARIKVEMERFQDTGQPVFDAS